MIPQRIRQWLPELDAACEALSLQDFRLILAAHLDVESLGGYALEPTGPAGTGDEGHGHGLMQIDDRSHGAFLALTDTQGVPLWKRPADNIKEGARIWRDEGFLVLQKRLSGSDLVDPDELPAVVLACSVAAYNAGAHRVLAAYDELTKPTSYEAILSAVDAVTTHGRYVTTVFGARDRFLLPPHEPSTPPPPRPQE